MNAFQQLGLPVSLSFEETEVHSAFQTALEARPTEKESLIKAKESLTHSLKRLTHWMEVHEISPKKHHGLSPELMDLFSPFSALLSEIKQLSQEKSEATSTLKQTIVFKKLFAKKPELDRFAEKIGALEERNLSRFDEIETAKNFSLAEETLNNLKFIQKWKASLDQAYASLY